MSKLRDEFEALYAQKYEQDTGHKLSTPLCELREDDHYGTDRTYLNAAWEWWQASRAALAVELPGACECCHSQDEIDMNEACAQAIEAAGVKVRA